MTTPDSTLPGPVSATDSHSPMALRWMLRLWLALLTGCLLAGLLAWMHQLDQGLAVTGLGRTVTWGLYIGQFTFFVGIAASAVVVVLPACCGAPGFARVAVFGETLAVVAVGMALLCVLADLGQPARLLMLVLHPAPGSIMFWDMLALMVYLLLNLRICTVLLNADRQALPPPRIKHLLWPTIILAVGIHVITAWIYAGLAGRQYWLTGLLAIKFLASACASGPAVLVVLLRVLRWASGYDPLHDGPAGDLTPSLVRCIAGALGLGLFVSGLEAFTALYSGLPAARATYSILFAHTPLAPLFWFGLLVSVLCLGGLLTVLIAPGHPAAVRLLRWLPWLLGASIVSVWIDKSPALLTGGFASGPEPAANYLPSGVELLVVTGIVSGGLLFLTLWWRHIIRTIQRPHTASS